MKNPLVAYFSKITTLSIKEAEVLTESMDVKHFVKGSFLIKEGQPNADTYFVMEGCVRQYELIDGNEITTNLFTEGQWIISLNDFEEKTGAPYFLTCVEDTALVVGNEQKAQKLFKQIPRFEALSRKVMEAVLREQYHQMSAYITEKPAQRYLRLLQTRPDIFQRVAQYDIATYIGVKPESLSRIRKKIQQQTKL